MKANKLIYLIIPAIFSILVAETFCADDEHQEIKRNISNLLKKSKTSINSINDIIDNDNTKFGLYKEGLLTEDISKFNIVGLKINEEKFKEIFPLTLHLPLEHGMYSGQIRENGSGVGTGTIINIAIKNDGTFEATGISALHVFIDHHIGYGGAPLFYYKDNKKFFQESKLEESGVNYLATIEIRELKCEKILSKDVCLFTGDYKLNGNYSKEDALEFVKTSQAFLPKFLEDDISSEENGFMHHYPLGKKEQRNTSGKVNSSMNNHKITSLKGSSGASIVSEGSKAIIGIHTGLGNLVNSSVDYEDDNNNKRVIPVVDSNRFEYISKKDIDLIVSSGFLLIPLYNLNGYLGQFPKSWGWVD